MADSLREQLIAAGLAPPVQEKKKRPSASASADKRKRGGGKKQQAGKRRHQQVPGNARSGKPGQRGKGASSDPVADAEIEARKQLKAKIKAIIEAARLEKWQGDVPYRYQVENKLRELYVSEAVQKKLAARELAITRLNGATYVVPSATAAQIIELNPLWTVFNSELTSPASDSDSTAENDEYSAFEVPDDLTW